MTRRDVDWHYLFEGLALRLGGCAVLLVAFFASIGMRADYAARADAAGQELAALEQRREELANRVKARARYTTRFMNLVESGTVGDEERLAWAQALRDAAGDLGLPYLRYTAGPRRFFQPDWLQTGAEAPVRATVMELQAGLVHEGDLLRLVDYLRAQAPGHFAVTGCNLERVGDGVAPEAGRANVAGTCQLRWHSIAVGAAAALAMETGE